MRDPFPESDKAAVMLGETCRGDQIGARLWLVHGSAPEHALNGGDWASDNRGKFARSG